MASLMTATPISQELINRSGGRMLVVKQVAVNRERHLQAFYLELSIMYLLRCSERFVELMGFTISPHFCILTIYYPYGSLDKFLYAGQGRVTSTRRLILSFAYQISDAVRILFENGFAHCDLKPHNVMIAPGEKDNIVGFCCRLGDFGLTQPLDDRHGQVKAFDFSSLRGLTIVYAAPEAILRFKKCIRAASRETHYPRCDIYSLSIIMQELCNNHLAWFLNK
jgi:serine/threonine protein kinase